MPLLRTSVSTAGVVLLVIAASGAATGCSHLVKVESKPIVIELHVKIDQDVRVQVEGGEVPAVLLTGQAQTVGPKKPQAVAPDAPTPP